MTMNQTTYQVILIALLTIGLVLSSAFLTQFRPRQWRRPAMWDAVGWILIVWLWYVRGLTVVIARWPKTTVPNGWLDLTASLGLLIVIDVLLAIRVVSFLSFRAADRKKAEAARAGATSAENAQIG
jgi:predicted membrane metal-binding protein